MIPRIGVLLLCGLLFLSPVTYAHHSVGANFDVGTIVEIEGNLTQISWRNPHVRLVITVRAEQRRRRTLGY